MFIGLTAAKIVTIFDITKFLTNFDIILERGAVPLRSM